MTEMTIAGRMFVEGESLPGESPRMSVQRLMKQLHASAAEEGCRPTGDISIMEYEGSPLTIIKTYRLEADVAPSV